MSVTLKGRRKHLDPTDAVTLRHSLALQHTHMHRQSVADVATAAQMRSANAKRKAEEFKDLLTSNEDKGKEALEAFTEKARLAIGQEKAETAEALMWLTSDGCWTKVVGTTGAIAALVEMLRSSDANVKAKAVQTLKNLAADEGSRRMIVETGGI